MRGCAASIVPKPVMRGCAASIVPKPAVRGCAASIVPKPVLRNGTASRRKKSPMNTEKALRYLGEPFLYVLELAKLNLDGIAAMRSGGSVLEAPPGAEEGALPREHRPRAGPAELYREREPVRRNW